MMAYLQDFRAKEKNPIVGGRSITLDIFAKDSDGKFYDCELQRSDEVGTSSLSY